jgi:peptidyl-prolyl cis-trans isomerase SurA
LNKQFREAVSALNPGETSEPFWTSKGLHIIQLTEKPGPEDNEEHFESIREKLFKEIFTKKYRTWIKHLREHSFIEIRL